MASNYSLWSEGLGGGSFDRATPATKGFGTGFGFGGGSATTSTSTAGDGDSAFSTKRSDKSLGRNTFSRMGKEFAMGLRPLYDERIARAREYGGLLDTLFRRNIALAGSDATSANIAKAGAGFNEEARIAAANTKGLLGDASSGNAAGLSQYYQDQALEKTFDYAADVNSPEAQQRRLMAMMGLTDQYMSGLLDFGALGQLHGLTQDLNPQSRNSGGGIGGLLGGIAGGLDWSKILGI